MTSPRQTTKPRTTLSLSLAVGLFVGVASAHAADETVDFSSQVRPILSDKCFHCHGPDAENQDSEFRADTQENLFADLGGYAAVVPGDLEASDLHARIHSDDESLQMPPPDSNRSLTDEQRRILDLWIKQGAPYEAHWSFTPPERPEPPRAAVRAAQGKPGWSPELVKAWSLNPIDAFLARRLIEEGLAPSPEADPATRLRRAALTLTGLLPHEELQQLVAEEPSAVGYEQAVDRLLDTDAYAERQAVRWLDAARYADTDGYQNDYGRTNWPWRDWVIKAFRDNMPFDRFTIEQVAGDMLPNATRSQRLASAFNRNHRQNSEGGALAAEFAVENVIDRVETTSTVWLGLTMGCARCHDHKYDPLSQQEFYQLYGYFNNIGEKGIGKGLDANPLMQSISPLVEVDPKWLHAVEVAEDNLKQARQGLDSRLEAWATELRGRLNQQDDDEAAWRPAVVASTSIEPKGSGRLRLLDDHTLVYDGPSRLGTAYQVAFATTQSTVSALRIEAAPDKRFGKPRRLAPSTNGNFVLTDLEVIRNGAPVAVASARASYEQPGHPASASIDGDPKSGWAVFGGDNGPVSLTITLKEPIDLPADETLAIALRFDSGYAGHVIGKFRVSMTDRIPSPKASSGLSDELLALVKKPVDKWSSGDRKKLRGHFESVDSAVKNAKKAVAAADRELRKRGGVRAKVMVMNERPGEPAPFYLLDRGQYDQPIKDQPLTRGVPKALLGDGNRQPKDRLDLAEWLVSPDNPLTARVVVNRIWQDHFGVGLVKTAEDFGLQGEVPSHPELLDWLAVEFIQSGWDVKSLHRLIVTSAAYRQSSRTNGELHGKDPENRLLARGPRYRADGFMIRDVALQASGLLNPEVGGPSVKPYQPKGLWEVVAANAGTRYKPSKGDDLYRKSMYSYWKRAVNPPRQTIFDAGGREVCNVRVRRTNTPLQALVLLNDPTFVESARHLAERGFEEATTDSDTDRLAAMYRAAIAREIDPETQAVLTDSLAFFREHYANKPEAAAKLLSIGESSRNESIDLVEHAAFTAVAQVIINLDEFITIE